MPGRARAYSDSGETIWMEEAALLLLLLPLLLATLLLLLATLLLLLATLLLLLAASRLLCFRDEGGAA